MVKVNDLYNYYSLWKPVVVRMFVVVIPTSDYSLQMHFMTQQSSGYKIQLKEVLIRWLVLLLMLCWSACCCYTNPKIPCSMSSFPTDCSIPPLGSQEDAELKYHES